MATAREPTPTGTKQPDGVLAWMDGLADPTRLRLLRILERHELGVAELCEILQLPQSTVSRHLKVLGGQGWVRSRALRTTRLYKMDVGEAEPAARRLWTLVKEQTESWATVDQDQLRLTRHLSERHPAAQAFFAGAAGEWDRMRADLYGHAFVPAAFLGLLPADWVVADLGCGTGQMTAQLAVHARQVIGIDQSPAMLKAAQRRTSGLDNVVLRRGTLEAIPIEDGTCDAALLVLALTYVSEPELVAAEMARILRAGGRAVVVDLLRHDRDDFRREMGQQFPGFTQDELAGWLQDAGLQGVACRTLPPEPQAKGPALLVASAERKTAAFSSRFFEAREE
jgi:SAM-dependent methyltransferase